METPNLNSKNNENYKKTLEAITRFISENEIDKLTFDTQEEAQAHVNMINSKYGDIAFVAEDRGGFSVKFKAEHIGLGFPENKENNLDVDIAA